MLSNPTVPSYNWYWMFEEGFVMINFSIGFYNTLFEGMRGHCVTCFMFSLREFVPMRLGCGPFITPQWSKYNHSSGSYLLYEPTRALFSSPH